jgi:hypothetical protein
MIQPRGPPAAPFALFGKGFLLSSYTANQLARSGPGVQTILTVVVKLQVSKEAEPRFYTFLLQFLI